VTAEIPIVVISRLPQTNEGRLKKEGAVGYFDKTVLNESSDSLVQALKAILYDSPNKLKPRIAVESDVSHLSRG
jgi:hypothetical protein